MNFSYNDEQLSYRKKIRDFAVEISVDNLQENDANSTFNKSGWLKCGEFGIQGGLIPCEFGGQGLDLLTYISGLELLGELCRDSGLLFSICAHVFACELSILNFGSDEQKRRWLPGLCSGKQIAAIAIAEKQGASDAFDMLTVAEPAQNGYILNGEKCYITNVPFCDIILTFARVKDSHDILCLMVERNTAGIAVHEIEKLGMRTAPFGAIIFNNCFIPETNILGQKNSGKLIFMGAMEWERGCILAPEVGVMERRLRETIDYVKKREQNSLPLSQRQSVSHRIVDMKVRVELSRLLLYKFVWEKQTRKRANMYASMVKLYIAEAVLQNTLDAMQIYGAYGYTCAADVERELRDSLALRIASGTSDIQRNIIAKWLNL